MNYEEMSDFEINMAVANRVFAESIVDYEVNPFPDVCSIFSFETDGGFGYFDGCNNPSDAWPIIFDNEISMCKPRKGGDVWNCFNRNCDVSFVENLTYHQNPLRAAMIVFLKMQEDNRG